MTPDDQRKSALVTGGGGQVANELEVTAPDQWRVKALAHKELDISSQEAVFAIIERERPRVVINTAAYTAVDRAERDVDRAFAVNDLGVGILADAADKFGFRLIHISTDFVFNGGQSHPYRPTDLAAPLNVYGKSKLAGENRMLAKLSARGLIVRTAWLYSHGNANFVTTILRLLKERDELTVVADQTGSPTWARNLATMLWRAAGSDESNGIYHWTDAGSASWYQFAQAIQAEALRAGLLERAIPIRPIKAAEYPALATRPRYSVLDCAKTCSDFGVVPIGWLLSLRAMLAELTWHRPTAKSPRGMKNQ